MKKFFWDFEKSKTSFLGSLAVCSLYILAFTKFCSGDFIGGISNIIFGVLIYLIMKVIETCIEMRTMILDLCEHVRDLLNKIEQEAEQPQGSKTSVENMDDIEVGHVSEGVGCGK